MFFLVKRGLFIIIFLKSSYSFGDRGTDRLNRFRNVATLKDLTQKKKKKKKKLITLWNICFMNKYYFIGTEICMNWS